MTSPTSCPGSGLVQPVLCVCAVPAERSLQAALDPQSHSPGTTTACSGFSRDRAARMLRKAWEVRAAAAEPVGSLRLPEELWPPPLLGRHARREPLVTHCCLLQHRPACQATNARCLPGLTLARVLDCPEARQAPGASGSACACPLVFSHRRLCCRSRPPASALTRPGDACCRVMPTEFLSPSPYTCAMMPPQDLQQIVWLTRHQPGSHARRPSASSGACCVLKPGAAPAAGCAAAVSASGPGLHQLPGSCAAY